MRAVRFVAEGLTEEEADKFSATLARDLGVAWDGAYATINKKSVRLDLIKKKEGLKTHTFEVSIKRV